MVPRAGSQWPEMAHRMLILLSHKNPTWCILLYINHKV
jgi:hypothetical protein